jgi:hypothetical protein
MVFMGIRTVLQILLQGIILKPKRMLMAKPYLYFRMAPRRVAHPLMGGGWGRQLYQKKVKKSLILKNKINATTISSSLLGFVTTHD